MVLLNSYQYSLVWIFLTFIIYSITFTALIILVFRAFFDNASLLRKRFYVSLLSAIPDMSFALIRVREAFCTGVSALTDFSTSANHITVILLSFTVAKLK